MAELHFFTGTMDSGKSTLALQTNHNHAARGRAGRIFTTHDRAGAARLAKHPHEVEARRSPVEVVRRMPVAAGRGDPGEVEEVARRSRLHGGAPLSRIEQIGGVEGVGAVGGGPPEPVHLEAAGREGRHRVAADEAGPAGDEDPPHRPAQSGKARSRGAITVIGSGHVSPTAGSSQRTPSAAAATKGRSIM